MNGAHGLRQRAATPLLGPPSIDTGQTALSRKPDPTDSWTANPARVVLRDLGGYRWTPWAQAERQRRQVQQLYEHLFQLYLQLAGFRTGGADLGIRPSFLQGAVEERNDDPLLTARVELSLIASKLSQGPSHPRPCQRSRARSSSGAPPEQLDEFRRFEQDFRKAPIAPGTSHHAKPVLQQALHVCA